MTLISGPQRLSGDLLFDYWYLERFPIECRKTKTKVITLANRNRCKQHHDLKQIHVTEKVARVLLTSHRA